MNCGPLHRLACEGALLVLAVWIAWAGAAYPLGRPSAHWPWTRSWFMFYRSSNREYQLGAVGRFQDGAVREIDLGRWFRRRAGLRTRRIDELRRDDWTMLSFADFLCRVHNENAGPRLQAVSILDRSWIRPAGRWLAMEQVPPREIHEKVWVQARLCQ